MNGFHYVSVLLRGANRKLVSCLASPSNNNYHLEAFFQRHNYKASMRIEPNNHVVVMNVKTTFSTNCATFPLFFMPNECWRDYSNWSAIFANHDLPGLSSWRLEKFQQTEANQNLPSIHHDGRKANISSYNFDRKLLRTRFRSRPHNWCVCCWKDSPKNILKPVLNIRYLLCVVD